METEFGEREDRRPRVSPEDGSTTSQEAPPEAPTKTACSPLAGSSLPSFLAPFTAEKVVSEGYGIPNRGCEITLCGWPLEKDEERRAELVGLMLTNLTDVIELCLKEYPDIEKVALMDVSDRTTDLDGIFRIAHRAVSDVLSAVTRLPYGTFGGYPTRREDLKSPAYQQLWDGLEKAGLTPRITRLLVGSHYHETNITAITIPLAQAGDYLRAHGRPIPEAHA